MPFCTLPSSSHGGGNLYYEEYGTGQPLLLVPGLNGLASFWAAQLQVFAAGFRVITFDHRGAGQSTHSLIRYSIEQMADDTLALMDHLKLERVHYVGHSTGGTIGQRLAARTPDRIGNLVLSATWPRADAYFKRAFALRKAVLETQGVRAYTQLGALSLYPPDYFAANFAALEDRAERSLATRPPAAILASRVDAIVEFDGWDALPGISQRTLVVCARDDMITPLYFSEQLAARLPHASLALLERGGHFCPVSEPADYNRVVLGFLRGS